MAWYSHRSKNFPQFVIIYTKAQAQYMNLFRVLEQTNVLQTFY